MDGSGIDWDAGVAQSQAPLSAFRQGQEAASSGIALRQQSGAAHALAGIDINNPGSLDAGLGNLVRYNALDQAKAVQDLAWTRHMRAQVPAWMDTIAKAMQGQDQPAAPSDTSAGPDPQHALETLNMAKTAADQLAALPESERPAAFAKIKADMLSRGLPEAAIDSAGQHLSGDGPQQLSQYYGGLIAHGTASLGGQELPQVAPHPSSAWYTNLANSGPANAAAAGMKVAGWDMTPLFDTAKTLAMPEIQKNADIAAAPIMAGIDVAKQQALVPTEVQKGVQTAVQTKAGTLPLEVMQRKLEADIAAAHDTLEVPVKDADGNVHTELYRKDTALKKGANGPIGANLSPNEQAGRNADASLFMTNYAKDANQGAIQSDLSARDTALAAAKMAQSPEINPSNLTDWAARNSNVLSAFGIDRKQANNLATYKNLVDQNLKNGIAVFPRNEVEFHAIANGVANAKLPGDAAALALTETAALHEAQAAYKQFRVSYAAQHRNAFSEKDFQTAWSQQPQANQSIFASPVFRDLKFNGKPAVAVMQQPYKDGHVYGVFMPGTPQKTVFRVR